MDDPTGILMEGRADTLRVTEPRNFLVHPWLLDQRDVHVWEFSLSAEPDALGVYRGLLSLPELNRADRFRFQRDQVRFISAHGQLRQVLSAYLQIEPDELDFNYGPYGKPALKGKEPSDLHFNLSHSEDVAVLAVTATGPVGIDLERIRPIPGMQQLVARFFSPRENLRFLRVPPSLRTAAFFNLWTRKEAFLKATGQGITEALKQVEVTFLPGEKPELLRLPDFVLPGDWSVTDVPIGAGFAGACVCSFVPRRTFLGRWSSFL